MVLRNTVWHELMTDVHEQVEVRALVIDDHVIGVDIVITPS